MKSRRERILKDTLSYTSANYISSFIGFFSSTFIKRFLGPLNAGYWAILTVIQSYAGYLGLGTKIALSREIPQAVGRGEEERVKQFQNLVFSYLLLASLIGTVLIVIISFFLFEHFSLRLASFLLGILIGLNHLYTLLITIARARKKFSLVSKMIIFNSIIVFIFGVTLTYFFQLIGLVIGLSLANLFSFYFGKKLLEIKFQFFLNPELLKKFVAIGIPMLGAGMLSTTFLNLDRIMIGKFIGMENLGFYTIAIMAATQLETIPKFFNLVIFPHIQESYGASGDILLSKGLILKSIYFSSRFLPFMLGGIIFLMEMIVKYILPQFEPGLASMRILLFGFYFLVLGGIFPNVIFTINKQIFLLPLYFVSIVISVTLNYIFIKLGWGIEGVAVGTSIAYFLHFLIVSLYASKFFLKKREILKVYFFIFLFFVYFLTGIVLIARLNIGGEELFKFILRFLILSIISLPVFFQIQRREKFFTSLLGILKEKK